MRTLLNRLRRPHSLFRTLKSAISNLRSEIPSPRPTRRRLLLETLENRSLMAGDIGIAISDASAIEGSSALKVLDRFVQEGSSSLSTPRGSVFGPDGNGDGVGDLYVVSAITDEILRYDGNTGAFLNAFITAGSGGLDNPGDLTFGPDGNLYVSSLVDPALPQAGAGKVLRYDGSTGAYIDTVASGLSRPLGLTFGANGNLYIANQDANDVLRYDGSAVSVFISPGSGGLALPRNAAFGPDGNIYVASQDSGQVLRYNGTTGAFIGSFVTSSFASGPLWLDFGGDGLLYTTVRSTVGNTSIARYNAHTGAFVDSYALQRDGWSFNIGQSNVIYNSGNASGNFVDRLGSSSLAAFSVSLSAASATPVTVTFNTANGTAASGSDYAATSGTVTFTPGQTTQTIIIQTLDDATFEGNETFTVNLSNPVGAMIADGQGVATITDNDIPPTKFYVTDDGSANKTFEYGASGTAIENYSVNSGNSAPRGAASTAAGDKVWVADANKNVYVYNTSGGLLGSWSAGSLPANTDVQGITTNGTDVWLVDAKGDKVYRYTGAASRTSGSQNAASSFSLNGSNTDPADLVTDGTSIWVVNNSSTDKIFKYTVSGSLLGSWTITSAGGSPTGITLDPANVSSLWIVDNNTDRIYEFASAASRTSGSASPSTSFPLASGNTNPQGIADPPVSLPLPLGEGRGEGASSATAGLPSSASHDAALLAITNELDSLLLGAKKRK